MSQLDNFRQVLKKENIGPDSNVDIPGNTAIKQKNEDESDKPKQTGRNRKTISREPQAKMKRTSIGLPGDPCPMCQAEAGLSILDDMPD